MPMSRTPDKGNQGEYNRLLRAFDAGNKSRHDCVYHLVSKGFSYDQASNAVHVYFKGGDAYASFKLSGDERNRLLDRFDAEHKSPKDCVDHLMKYGCTYHQATSAVYQYRVDRGLIRR